LSVNDGERSTKMPEIQAVILLVGADADTTALVDGALAGHGVLVAAKSLEGASKLAKSRTPSVILVDDGVKDRTPEDVMQALHAIAPHAKAIVLTSAREPRDLQKLAALGPVITRPIDAERLAAAIRNTIRLAALATGVDRLRTGQYQSMAPAAPESRRSPTRRDPE
jgi:DNA-binding NarL/FixJ family response regulator